MKLYFLRHGIAVAHGAPGFRHDSERPLTPQGERGMKRIAAGIQALEVTPGVILSSPYVRARRTAEIVASTLGISKDLKLSKNLAADADPADLVKELKADYAACPGVMLVGHEPYLSGLISVLAAGNADPILVFKKGSLCRLTVDNLAYGRCATLDWLLTPRQLKRLGR